MKTYKITERIEKYDGDDEEKTTIIQAGRKPKVGESASAGRSVRTIIKVEEVNEMAEQESVSLGVFIPLVTLSVGTVGSNSLIGGLTEYLRDTGHLQDIGLITFEAIHFNIKSVHPAVDIYAEINAVRDIFKIDEKKIKVFFQK